MKRRMKLFFGLVAALAVASTATATGTESTSLAWGTGAATKKPAASDVQTPPHDAIAAWKSISQENPVEIRFKKPGTVVLSDQSVDITTEDISPASATTIEQAPSKPADSTPDAANLPGTLIEKSAHPKAPTAALAVVSLPSTATEQPTAETDSQANQPRVDEHVQLVARMFQEDTMGDVPPIPGDEPLPNKAPVANNNANNKEPFKDPADYNYAGDVYGAYCPPPAAPLIWVAGVEATFLSPNLNNDGVSFAFEEFAVDRADWASSHSSAVDSMYVAPRIWLGVQGCKWGANLRYWHMNASEGYFDPSVGAGGLWDAYDCGIPDLGFISNSRFEAYTVDLEITRRFCLHDCWMQFSAGVRHAEFEYGESLIGNAITDDANFMGFAAADRYTRGTGIVLGLYGRKPLFPCSCVNWFYNVRWSAVWGPTETNVETAAYTSAPGATAGSINGASTCVNDNLMIGEIQLGLEWNYALRCMPANAFFRAAVEYQRWDGGKGYSEASSFAGIEVDDDYEALVETFAGSAAPQLDLVGISLGTGLTW